MYSNEVMTFNQNRRGSEVLSLDGAGRRRDRGIERDRYVEGKERVRERGGNGSPINFKFQMR